MAGQVAEVFTEVIVAPGYEPAALEILQAKPSIRILQVPAPFEGEGVEMRSIDGGVLVQVQDKLQAEGDSASSWKLVSGEASDAATLSDLLFAWTACRSVKSNAILLAKQGAAVGIGMGQVNRVDSAALAVSRAGERVAGSVAASDAFFPFADGLQTLIDAGVRAVVQPGGSVRDEEVIAAAKAAGITMYFTGTRHFFH
jgi:phosphoribosylaminoimidazolecarboxamide formyltransferase/IMP cyclohydrolase